MIPRFVQRLRGRAATPPTVAMLHPGRVGSTVLGTMLGDRGDVVWDGELFEKHRSVVIEEFREGLPPVEVIRRRRARHPDETYVFAFKPTPSLHLGVLDLDLDGFIDVLDEAGVDHLVLLHRRNHLRRVVSGAVGRARGTYHQRAADGPADLVRITLDLDKVPFGAGGPLLAVFEEMATAEAELREKLGDRAQLWLYYEDDVEQDPTVGYERICAFLGLPQQDIDVRLRRTTPFALTEVIENYDEVAAHLAGTEHAWMLDES